jgi:MerR family transcriptional regulator, light-induced transcriptional regulator
MIAGRRLRIGELSRRVGVSPEALRAWETRYGLLTPERTAGGLRLFSQDDERRVRLMRQYIAEGLSASEAARLVLQHDERSTHESASSIAEIRKALEEGSDALDEVVVLSAFDRLLEALPLGVALSEVILPFLHQLGERWATGQMSVANEHFASNLIGARLRGLTVGWGSGVGPLAILGCPVGERHDLGLPCFGLALREHGWRIAYFGADTPVHDLVSPVDELSPAIVVLAAIDHERFTNAEAEISALSRRVRVAIAGAGATATIAQRLGVELLDGDAIAQAALLAA